jgi:hypothetical protein
MMTQWMVVVTGPELLADIRRASDDQLSFIDAAAEVMRAAHPYNVHLADGYIDDPYRRSSWT